MTAPASPRLAAAAHAAAQRAPAAAAAPPPGATAAAGFTLAAWLGPEMHALYGARFNERGLDQPLALAALEEQALADTVGVVKVGHQRLIAAKLRGLAAAP